MPGWSPKTEGHKNQASRWPQPSREETLLSDANEIQGAEPWTLSASDGFALGAHLFRPAGTELGTVIINPATGVLARYYHRYARFLAEQGFAAITYDYRGIGASRPASLRGHRFGYRDWGELDLDAVIRKARARSPQGSLALVGHSIGGFLVGYAKAAVELDRMLVVGSQYAYWRDYARAHRSRLFVKWHLAMPAISALVGYFPGRRLGWLEDLPTGVVREWAFRRARFEENAPLAMRPVLLARFAAVRAPILSIALSDDEFATDRAVRRGLAYYRGSERKLVALAPTELGFPSIGHFGLFHARHRDGFWRATASWLRDGVNPWSSNTAVLAPGQP